MKKVSKCAAERVDEKKANGVFSAKRCKRVRTCLTSKKDVVQRWCLSPRGTFGNLMFWTGLNAIALALAGVF